MRNVKKNNLVDNIPPSSKKSQSNKKILSQIKTLKSRKQIKDSIPVSKFYFNKRKTKKTTGSDFFRKDKSYRTIECPIEKTFAILSHKGWEDQVSEKLDINRKVNIIFMENDSDLIELHKWSFVSGSEILGEGTYGKVYKMSQASNGEVRAFKRVFFNSKSFPSWLIRELSLLSILNHPNVINLKQVFIGPERVYLSFPYINGGTLLDLMHSKYIDGMPKSLIKTIMRQMCCAISHCHQNRVIHRDLKPENILCQFDGNKSLSSIFLADFGLARTFRWPNQNLSPEVVTLFYRPIEILLGMYQYSSAVDMWSVGCILLEMLIGPVAFKEIVFGCSHSNEFSVVLDLIRNFGLPSKKEWPALYKFSFSASMLPKLSPKITIFEKIKNRRSDLETEDLDLLTKILNLNPDKRLSADLVLAHDWLN